MGLYSKGTGMDHDGKTIMPRCVLIIEDTADCARRTTECVHRHDPTALCDNVLSLHEAIVRLDAARQMAQPYDLVILDLSALDTAQTMAVVPTIQAASPSPVLVLTNGSPLWKEQVLSNGAKMLLLQRTSQEEFTHALEELMPHGRYHQPAC